MAATQPLFMFGLEVPAGDVAISGRTEIPYGFRITMAAIDPSAEPEGEEGVAPRATLKVIRQALEYVDDDEDDYEDDEDFDVDEMERMLAGEDEDDSEDDSEAELANGGPSDPAKVKAAKKAAANKIIRDMLSGDDDMEVDGGKTPNGINGLKKSAKALGKMRALEEDDDDDLEEDDDDEDGEIEEFVICTLDPAKNYQQPLDITIREDERVWFKVSGTHTVYLTGNYYRDLDEQYGDDDDDDMDDDEYDLEPDSDELDDDTEDELDDISDPRITELDDDIEEDVPDLVESRKKAEKKGKNRRPAEEDVSMSLDDSITEAKKAEANGEPKLSKKQQKKLKKNDGTPSATAAEDASAKSDKKVSFAKNLEQGPTPTKSASAAADSSKDSGNKSKPTPSLGVKVVQGVTIDDKKLGAGPAAKAGDRVSMRYIGKLQKDNSVFDKNTKGKPFTFKLGAGEVIKGWDIGIAGMCAGGERRITIPAHLAYGRQAQGSIPANSTLIFDVKALDIKKK